MWLSWERSFDDPLLRKSSYTVVLVPSLYLWGVSYFGHWIQTVIPARQKVSDNIFLGLIFAVGAILSGILGNPAYDVLKFLVRKSLRR
jgi:hypothetical protein